MRRKLTALAGIALIGGLVIPAAASGGRNHHTGGIELEFIGEATFPTGFMYDDTEVGGLSGIDYDQSRGSYVAISDDRAQNGPARFYDLTIDLADGSLDEGDVAFTKVTEIFDTDGSSFAEASLDPEAIRVQEFPPLLYWTSEGDANAGIPPFVRIMTRDGQHVAEFETPDQFAPTADSGIRNNLAFESLTFGATRNKLFTATEGALVQDGPAASLAEGSPVRVVRLNNRTGAAKQQYIYETEPIPNEPIPADAFATNGLVELLALDNHTFLAIERAFSVGVGNSIKIYEASLWPATNVKRFDSIEGRHINPMSKELVFDLDELGITLDNIEGVTFGPVIDGEQTLILVSDNNFNPNGQFTQFLAFTISGI